MPLLLRIEEPPDLDRPVDQGSARLVEVDTELRIGRAADNDLVLADPDRVLSKQHCVVRLDAGRYVVLDGSANGTFLNGGGQRLVRGEPVPLAAGDAIQLGAFTLTVVSVILPDAGLAGTGAVETGADPLGPVSHAPAPVVASPQPRAARQDIAPAARNDIDAFLDSMNGLAEGVAEDFLEAPAAEPWQAVPVPVAADPDHVPPVQEVFPRPRTHREAIPDDWDPLAEIGAVGAPRPGAGSPGVAQTDKAAPPPLVGLGREADQGWGEGEAFVHLPAFRNADGTPPEPARSQQSRNADLDPQPAPADDGRRAVDLLLSACGLDPATVSDAKAAAAAERAGRVMRIAVDGMLQILGSRSVAKQEFGMQRTAISRGANNVMKFVATAEEALQMLLCNDIPGFLRPEEAMRETVSDIHSHHLALLSGVRAAFADTLRRLDPAAIEQALPHGAADSIVPALRKARAWDAFRAKYAELERSLAGDGHDMLGSEFARAYAAIQKAATKGRSVGAEASDDAG